MRDIEYIIPAMDNIIDRTTYPLDKQAQEANNKRRMGLGFTGVANTGEALGYPYGSKEFIDWFDNLLEMFTNKCYQTSAYLAGSRGTFPLYDEDMYLQSKFIAKLSDETKELIKKYGIRNSHLTSIAPTGTISLTADNVSSGIEPVFSHEYDRTIRTEDGEVIERVADYGYRNLGIKGVTANECSVQQHLDVLITTTKWIDSAVSKTLNVGPNVSWNDFKDIYMRAWKEGCKGATTFRANGKRYGILNEVKEDEPEGGACYFDLDTGQKSCS